MRVIHTPVSGPQNCQNLDSDFKSMLNKDKIHFSLNSINRTLTNGNVVKRDWVIFSPTLQSVLCFSCKLFGNAQQNMETFRTDGFNDWKNCTRGFQVHESSTHHMSNYLAYRTREKNTNTIDANFLKEQQMELNYWREVLRRVVSVIKFLASRGLPFRGKDERFGSSSNGNYLGILELLSDYDPFLASHIANYGNKGKGIYIGVPLTIRI